jgi:hypothetical protein
MDTLWKTILGRQYGAAIDMLENALVACPDELWGDSLWNNHELGPDFAQFWYLAYHALFFLDLYLSGAVEGFAPPAPFTLGELDPAGVLPDRQYTRAELLAYLEHGRRKCQATIAALTDERANQLCRFSWLELPFAELLVDNMRHVQEHGAQLNMYLGQKKDLNARWAAKPRS